MSNGFFEGTEKKVELVVSPETPDLRGLGEARWREIVESASAEILSSFSTEQCDAYLLSESSLFVFESKMLMITCGQTRLIDAVGQFLHDVPAAEVRLLIYERKNEVFPHSQPTSFYEDARALRRLIPGKALRFGDQDEHHLYLYHLEREPDQNPDDVTLEVLMHGLSRETADLFDRRRAGSDSAARRTTAMQGILPGYRFEEHLFEPSGYSMNALQGAHYGTVHVTPQEHGSYASFETNHPIGADASTLCAELLDLFRPRAFDIVLFDQGQTSFSAPERYATRARVSQQLDCGYHVRFLSYSMPPAGDGRPQVIPISAEEPVRGNR